MTYAEQLKDPRWQKRRLEILQRDEWTCQHCAGKESTLHVHHRRYRRGMAPWQYADRELVTLCEVCHEAITLLGQILNDVVGDLGWREFNAVLGFAKAMRLTVTDSPLDPLNEMQMRAMQAAQDAFPDDRLADALATAAPMFINGKRVA